jgi:hypothetical protein
MICTLIIAVTHRVPFNRHLVHGWVALLSDIWTIADLDESAAVRYFQHCVREIWVGGFTLEPCVPHPRWFVLCLAEASRDAEAHTQRARLYEDVVQTPPSAGSREPPRGQVTQSQSVPTSSHPSPRAAPPPAPLVSTPVAPPPHVKPARLVSHQRLRNPSRPPLVIPLTPTPASSPNTTIESPFSQAGWTRFRPLPVNLVPAAAVTLSPVHTVPLTATRIHAAVEAIDGYPRFSLRSHLSERLCLAGSMSWIYCLKTSLLMLLCLPSCVLCFSMA